MVLSNEESLKIEFCSVHRPQYNSFIRRCYNKSIEKRKLGDTLNLYRMRYEFELEKAFIVSNKELFDSWILSFTKE